MHAREGGYRGARSIRAITLDLDDTLWPCEPTLHTRRAPRPRMADRACARGHRALVRSSGCGSGAWRSTPLVPSCRHDFRTIRRLALEEVFREAGADDAQSAEIIEGSLDVYMTARNEVELYPEVRACLERLSAQYRIASLSNGNACLVQIGLDHLFHAIIAAHTHGASKPDPALFHIACRELGCAPEEVVHLGDDIELDVRGARGAGLHAVWINRASHSWPGDDVPDTVADLEAFERWLAQG